MKKKTLRILVRTCENSKKGQSRAFDFSNTGEVILESVSSLLKSCLLRKDRIVVNIVDDSSSEEFRDKLRGLLSGSGISGKVLPINGGSYGANFDFCLDQIGKSRDDLFFLVEDDYLFLEHAIPYILDAYDNQIIGTGEFAIHPSDYPDRYDKVYPSYIFLSKKCHWRSVGHTTGTFLITKNIYKKYKKLLYNHSTMIESESLNKIWEEVPLISPIPSLAAHLNYDTLPPFINWQKLLTKHFPKNPDPKDSSVGETLTKKVKGYVKIFYKKVLNKPFIKKAKAPNLKSYSYLPNKY